MTATTLDIDLTDGTFYADGGAREAYKWMRANQPVFRDRNGLAAATTYQAVLDAERNPEVFSSAGGIRPDQPGMPYMIDMDDPAHLLRRKLVNSGFTRKRVMDKVGSIEALCDTLNVSRRTLQNCFQVGLSCTPLDFIKIDGSFVKDMLQDKADWTTVEMINQISHLTGRKTIAEFVENDEILSALRQLGVDYAQGYAIGRPIPLSSVLDDLRQDIAVPCEA